MFVIVVLCGFEWWWKKDEEENPSYLYTTEMIFFCSYDAKPYVNCRNNRENYVTIGSDIKM